MMLSISANRKTPGTRRRQKSAKSYIAGVSFGATTPSYDLEKDIDRHFPCEHIDRELIEKTLPSFIGVQEQIAPLFSAKSVEGVRVYELARQRYKRGLPLEDTGIIQASKIEIYGLKLLDFSLKSFEKPDYADGRINVADISGERLPTALLQVDCSKGTYIRALARDLGEAVGSLLSEKLPTKVARIGINDEFGHSGPAGALLKQFGLCAKHIAGVAQEIYSE